MLSSLKCTYQRLFYFCLRNRHELIDMIKKSQFTIIITIITAVTISIYYGNHKSSNSCFDASSIGFQHSSAVNQLNQLAIVDIKINLKMAPVKKINFDVFIFVNGILSSYNLCPFVYDCSHHNQCASLPSCSNSCSAPILFY